MSRAAFEKMCRIIEFALLMFGVVFFGSMLYALMLETANR